MTKNSFQKGFSFVEMLIVLAMLAILAAIIYPTYMSYMMKTNRADGQAALLDLSARMERYLLQHRSYEGVSLEKLGAQHLSPHRHYALEIVGSHLNNTQYLLQANPVKRQASDVKCGSLTLDQSGKRGITGIGKVKDCW